MLSDWRDHSALWPPNETWAPGMRLGVTEVLWTLGEYFTLASRLVLSLPATPVIVIHIRVGGLHGRILTVDDPRRAPMVIDRTTATDVFDTRAQEFTLDQLVANHRDLAVDAASDLFARFGWEPDRGLLRDNLDELWQPR